ncbi:MAG: FAD-dependent oxidoreductase [Deltaproteobacteria bacterium]|nr:FAD-dependent oxidoreductase [Deltaproteobacteria bacterium]
MLGGLLIMGCLGVLCGVGLALASKIFYVYVDPKVEAVSSALPGANCGGCGFPGCGANAEAIVAGKSSPSSCVAGGPDLGAEIAAILGVKLEAREPDTARPGCTYGYQDAERKFIYEGIHDCVAATLLYGGSKVCPIGCIGLGTCVRACPFDALSMGPDNLPVVNPDKCTGCGTCERVCPKHIITLTSNTRRVEREYTTEQCTAPCQRACPAGIEIPVYIRKIKEGDILGAVRVIKETNPFPLVCGRICVHPCEYECRRNLVDEPVAINHLKRFAADYEMKSGQRVQIPRAPASGKRAAVVGGGAEGLTAAYFLNRMGHDSVVYEGSSRLGGLLRTGIAENRLPQKILDYEIESILDAGVEAKMNLKLGRNFGIASLLEEGFEAVLVTTGGWDAQMGDKDRGRTLPGVNLLIDFILKHSEGKALSSGRKIMIIGGGQAALQAAMACLEFGAESVNLILRKDRDRVPYREEEISRGEAAGICFHFKKTVTRMVGVGAELTHVEVASVSEEGQAQEERELLPVDLLLTGAGRFPELIYVRSVSEEEAVEMEEGASIRWETLVPYAGPFAEQDIGIFRPGEEIGDYKAVVEAIGAGRRTANSAHRFLTGRSVESPPNMIRKWTDVLNLKEIEPVAVQSRIPMPESSPDERIKDPNAEIALGYSEDQAVQEARRCLQCGLICYRRVDGAGRVS